MHTDLPRRLHVGLGTLGALQVAHTLRTDLGWSELLGTVGGGCVDQFHARHSYRTMVSPVTSSP